MTRSLFFLCLAATGAAAQTPGMGLVTVTSKAPATVQVDGVPLGQTPLEGLPLAEGAHEITVCFGPEECAPPQQVTVAAEKPVKLKFDEKPAARPPAPAPKPVPDDPDALLNAAIGAIAAGHRDQAIAHLSRAIALRPTVAAHGLMCSAQQDERAFDKALEHCREAHRLDVDPSSRAVWEKKIRILEQRVEAPAEPAVAPDAPLKPAAPSAPKAP